jgi:hypothetical protein
VIGFLAEVGQKIADRWVNLLVLPGLLWAATAVTAVTLGQRDALDVPRLRAWLNTLIASPPGNSAAVLLTALGLLLSGAAAGLAAAALGGLVQRFWVQPGDRGPLARLLSARQRRWDEAASDLKAAIAAANSAAMPADLARANTRVKAAKRHRAALGPSRPRRPTRIADAFLTTATRVHDAYGMDLELTWPRLWPLLPDSLRTDLDRAQDAYAGSARLTGWGLLYVLLGVVWWPGTLLGTLVTVSGWTRARSAASVLANLIEAAVDLHTSDLAIKLGVAPASAEPSVLTRQTGQDIDRVLRKAASPPAV